MDQAAAAPKKTPLHARHRASGAKMAPFGGWDMPIEYGGISEEHMAVRERAGLFDVSHMGEIEIAGKDALAAVQRISCNDASKLQVGQAHYSGLTTPQGTFLDDLLVYRLAKEHFLLVVNASHISSDFAHISTNIAGCGDAVAFNASSRYALLAVQGPRARDIVQPLTGVDLAAIKYYWFAHGEVASVRATISRTGYTGEDGFEILSRPNRPNASGWPCSRRASLTGSCPVGSARATHSASKRECAFTATTSTRRRPCSRPTLAGSSAGRNLISSALTRCALEEHRAYAKAVGFELLDPGIARHGHDVYIGGAKAGLVTSGTQTPFLKRSIGMAHLPIAHTSVGTEFAVDVRGRRARARVVPLPFYTRPKT